MHRPPTISAIIPSKNRPRQVDALLRDLRGQQYPPDQLEIIVVDDGSDPPYALQDMPARVLRHEVSRGAQASRNEGLAAATGELAFILDDDIELIDVDFLARAADVWQQHPEVAAVFPQKIDVLHQPDGQQLHEFSVARPTWYSGDLVKTQAPAGPIQWSHSICLIRRDLLLRLGGYDGIYGLNGGHSFREESDLQARLRRQGRQLWFLPQITIKHHVTATGGHGPAVGRRLYWIAHNHMVFLHRHQPAWMLRALGFVFDIARYSWVQGRGRYVSHMVRGYLAGWRNALRDRGPDRNTWLAA